MSDKQPSSGTNDQQSDNIMDQNQKESSPNASASSPLDGTPEQNDNDTTTRQEETTASSPTPVQDESNTTPDSSSSPPGQQSPSSQTKPSSLPEKVPHGRKMEPHIPTPELDGPPADNQLNTPGNVTTTTTHVNNNNRTSTPSSPTPLDESVQQQDDDEEEPLPVSPRVDHGSASPPETPNTLNKTQSSQHYHDSSVLNQTYNNDDEVQEQPTPEKERNHVAADEIHSADEVDTTTEIHDNKVNETASPVEEAPASTTVAAAASTTTTSAKSPPRVVPSPRSQQQQQQSLISTPSATQKQSQESPRQHSETGSVKQSSLREEPIHDHSSVHSSSSKPHAGLNNHSPSAPLSINGSIHNGATPSNNDLMESPRSVYSNVSKRSVTSRRSMANGGSIYSATPSARSTTSMDPSEPNTNKVFHTIDLLGVEYKCVITTCNQRDPQLLYWTINVFSSAKTDAGEDPNALCYELIIRAKQAKQITHGQMSARALRDLVKEALFRTDRQDNAYFRYFFMKPPGVDIYDGDRIADKARGNRLRAPSGPNDTLVFKIVMKSTVGDIAFWLPLKPVFGVFSKFSQDQLEHKISGMEKRFHQYDNANDALRRQILSLKSDNTRLENQIRSESDEKVQILQRISSISDESRNHTSTLKNLQNLVRQQQHRMQETQQQIQSSQNHSQRENQELKDLILKETEKSMRMKLSIAAQNEHYAKLMHQVRKDQDSLEARVTKLEQVGAEEVIENVQLNVRELQEQFNQLKQSGVGPGSGARLTEDAQQKIDDLTENYEKLEREIERLKNTRPTEAIVNADIKKLKQQNDILRKNHLRCLKENAAIKLENMELKQMIKTLQDDNKDLQKDLEELLQRDNTLPPPSSGPDYGATTAPADDNDAMMGGMEPMGGDANGGVDYSSQNGVPNNEEDYMMTENGNLTGGSDSYGPRWNPDYLGSNLSLSDSNRTVQRSSQRDEHWQTAIGEKTYVQNGVYRWEVKLTDACADADIFIGVVDPAEIDVNSQDISEMERGWALYAADGCVYHSGQERDYASELFTGSVIGVILNLEDNTLRFEVDGTDMGVAFSNVTAPLAPAVSLNYEDNYSVTFL